MARTFRRHRVAHPIADLNITNLVDLAFVLLIVFMITAQVIREEQTITVKLPPDAKSAQQKPDPTQRVETVTINAAGDYYLNGKPIRFSDLQVQLRAFGGEPKKPAVRIAADVDTRHGRTMAVVTELKKNGLNQMDLAFEAAP